MKIWLSLHSHKIAVCIPRKCASTSIASAIENIAGASKEKTPQTNKALGPYTYEEVIELGYRRAMFIRRPDERIASFWRHVVVRKGCRTAGIMEAGYRSDMTFNECALHACANPYANEHTTPYTAFGATAEFYGIVKNLSRDWGRFCEWAGVQDKLPFLNAGPNIEYEWSMEAMSAMHMAYAEDFALFERVSC